MSSIVDLTGLDRLIVRVQSLGRLDATPLMKTFGDIIEADNRKGVLAGLDKDDNAMRPVTYRPNVPRSNRTRTHSRMSEDAKRQRLGQKARLKRGEFFGFGPHASGLNNNLTSKEYRKLDGPPLAPRRQFSRVVTNLRRGFEHSGDFKQWTAYGFWDQVVSTKGVSFLGFHFKGSGQLPVRSLAGVRPDGREKARSAAIAWMADQIRAIGSTSRAA